MQLTLVTSRYAEFTGTHPTLAGQALVPVRTSIGLPKFLPVARHWARCAEITPGTCSTSTTQPSSSAATERVSTTTASTRSASA